MYFVWNCASIEEQWLHVVACQRVKKMRTIFILLFNTFSLLKFNFILIYTMFYLYANRRFYRINLFIASKNLYLFHLITKINWSITIGRKSVCVCFFFLTYTPPSAWKTHAICELKYYYKLLRLCVQRIICMKPKMLFKQPFFEFISSNKMNNHINLFQGLIFNGVTK